MAIAGAQGSTGARISGLLLAAVLGVVALLLFVLVYVSLPSNDHVGGYLAMGVLALLLALAGYFVSPFSTDARSLRLAAGGLGAVGFALLIGALLFAPSPDISFLGRIVGLIVVLLVLAIALAGTAWRFRGAAAEAVRAEGRAAWASRPPMNALDYPAAQTPGGPPSPSASTEHR